MRRGVAGAAARGFNLTSPPYDNLREYGGYNDAFDFDAVAGACVADFAPRGLLVWDVRDGVVDGSETGTSFRQALGFMGLGPNWHQTMAFYHWSLAGSGGGLADMRVDACYRDFEHIFAFSKGKPKTANLLRESRMSAQAPKGKHRAVGRTGDTSIKFIPSGEGGRYRKARQRMAIPDTEAG